MAPVSRTHRSRVFPKKNRFLEQPQPDSQNYVKSRGKAMRDQDELFSDLSEALGEDSADAASDQQPVDEGGLSWQEFVETFEEQAEADDPVVQLVQEYKEAIKARDEAEDRYLRAAAEFANARRRAELRADLEVRAAKELILSGFLPVVDDLDRAMLAVPADGDAYPWLEGFSLIQRKLASALERQGVTPIQAEGQPFDPVLHQAVIMEDAGDTPSGTVLQELQRGYLLEGRVLRPAMVKVAQ
jgi:molecular chaperone GrpE